MSHEYPFWILAVNFVLAIGTVVIAVFGVVQAKASKRSAEALISSERAWLMVEFTPTAYRAGGASWYRSVGGMQIPLSDDELISGVHLKHQIRLINMGRTPATILSFEVAFGCLPEGARTIFENSKLQCVTQNSCELFVTGGNSLEIDNPFIDVDDLIGPTISDIKSLKKTAVFRGKISYQHIFSGANIESADCLYVYTPSLSRLTRVYTPRTLGRQKTGLESFYDFLDKVDPPDWAKLGPEPK